MGARWQHLKRAIATGEWATPERLRAYSALLIGAYLVATASLVLTGAGNVDASGRPIGADFGMIWTAGRTALDGRPEEVFSLSGQADLQASFFGERAPFTPWHYPPVFLLVAAALAALPYLGALMVWQGLTLVAYLAGIRACAGEFRKTTGWAMLLSAAFPAAFINLAHGQNGFLTASLLTGGVLLLRTRPVMAGVLFALLAYKPQFGVLIPVVLLAGGHWRAIVSAGLAAGAVVGGTILVFGADTWSAFFASAPDAKRLTLETGATGWEKIQSVFGALRLLGASYETALAVQVATGLLTAAAVALVWRSKTDEHLKQALFLSGVLLTTPYCIDYDMVVLAPALALLALHGLAKGFAPYEVSLMAVVFATPMIARIGGAALHAPLGPVVLLVFFLWVLARAMRETRTGRFSPLPED